MQHSDSLKGFEKDKDNKGIANMADSESLLENIEAMNFDDNAKNYTNLEDECSSDLGGRIFQQGVIENARKEHNSGNGSIKEISSKYFVDAWKLKTWNNSEIWMPVNAIHLMDVFLTLLQILKDLYQI